MTRHTYSTPRWFKLEEHVVLKNIAYVSARNEGTAIARASDENRWVESSHRIEVATSIVEKGDVPNEWKN